MDEAALLETIGDELVARRMYEVVVDTEDVERVRRLGRRAGRQRGVNVVTRATQPDDGGRAVVIIANVTPVAEDDELGQRRRWARMRAAVDSMPAYGVRLLAED